MPSADSVTRSGALSAGENRSAVHGGDVGHLQRVLRVADVEPAGDLPRGEARHSQLAAKGCELVGRFAV